MSLLDVWFQTSGRRGYLTTKIPSTWYIWHYNVNIVVLFKMFLLLLWFWRMLCCLATNGSLSFVCVCLWLLHLLCRTASERHTHRRLCSLDPPLEDGTSGSPKATSEEDLCCAVLSSVCVLLLLSQNPQSTAHRDFHIHLHFPGGA